MTYNKPETSQVENVDGNVDEINTPPTAQTDDKEDIENLSVNQEKFLSEDARITDHKAERKLTRKLDFHILPLIAVMYLFNALDKGNISNAKTDGIENDLNMLPNQWNILMSIFYIPFVLFALPLSFVIKRFTAATVIPILMIAFGSLSLLCASVFNFEGLMALRWFLGMAESPFFPGIIYYLSTFYRRGELARRLAFFYAAANIANAFSGLLAYGLFQIKGALHGWQYLFLVEGGLTVLIAIVSFLLLPRTVERAKFFNEDEKALAFHRIQTDSSAVVGESVSVRDALQVFKHPVTIGWLLISMCVGVPINSINNFGVQIVNGLLGDNADQSMSNLLSAPPNVWGAVALILFAFASDLTNIRSVYIIASFVTTLVGFVLYACIDPHKQMAAGYISVFLMCTGGSSSSVILVTWYNNNTPGETKRAVLSAVGVPLSNAVGLISSNIFFNREAPTYPTAIAVTAAFCGAGLVLTSLVLTYMWVDNKRRNRQQGVNWTFRDVSTAVMAEGPKNPSFRWYY